MSGVTPIQRGLRLCEVHKIPVDDMAHVKWVEYNQKRWPPTT